MGRNKYTPEQRTEIITTFLSATKAILDVEGVKGVSIRKVAANAGYNSATLYLYFKDVNDLITLASIGYLEGYCGMLAHSDELMPDTLTAYLYSWRVFSRYATVYPDIFYQLFFSKHSEPLSESIERYYSIYPEQLNNLDDKIYDMLNRGELAERNLVLLTQLAKSNVVETKRIENINRLTVAYFKSLLEEYMEAEDHSMADDSIAQKMQEISIFLLQLS